MTARVRVDLDALVRNYTALSMACPDDQVAAVVKADAYGLGALAVTRRLLSAGCDTFFVANCVEAETLIAELGGERKANTKVYVLEGPRAETAVRLAACGAIPVVNSFAQLHTWRPHHGLPIAIHVDTGMQRLGFSCPPSTDELSGFQVDLLLSHLACADEPQHALNALQVQRFIEIAKGFPGVVLSLSNSASTLCPELVDLAAPQICRAGISLYGGGAFRVHADNQRVPMHTVACLEGRVLQVRAAKAGATAGYGATWRAQVDTRIAVLGIGHADGVPRALANVGQCALGGQRFPIVGSVSMDLLQVAVDDSVAEGDWMEVFGNTIALSQVAAWADTIDYEILTRIGPRVARIY